MVRLIMGANGAGKTKQLIDLIHSAVESENGSVVCIEPGADMTFDIKSSVRLVNAKEYSLNSFECLRGFISGLSPAITIFPMCSWTTWPRSLPAATWRRWRSSSTGWTASARRTASSSPSP